MIFTLYLPNTEVSSFAKAFKDNDLNNEMTYEIIEEDKDTVSIILDVTDEMQLYWLGRRHKLYANLEEVIKKEINKLPNK